MFYNPTPTPQKKVLVLKINKFFNFPSADTDLMIFPSISWQQFHVTAEEYGNGTWYSAKFKNFLEIITSEFLLRTAYGKNFLEIFEQFAQIFENFCSNFWKLSIKLGNNYRGIIYK